MSDITDDLFNELYDCSELSPIKFTSIYNILISSDFYNIDNEENDELIYQSFYFLRLIFNYFKYLINKESKTNLKMCEILKNLCNDEKILKIISTQYNLIINDSNQYNLKTEHIIKFYNYLKCKNDRFIKRYNKLQFNIEKYFDESIKKVKEINTEKLKILMIENDQNLEICHRWPKIEHISDVKDILFGINIIEKCYECWKFENDYKY